MCICVSFLGILVSCGKVARDAVLSQTLVDLMNGGFRTPVEGVFFKGACANYEE